MAWHVASRSALSAHGLAEPLSVPLDIEYASKVTPSTWWRPEQRTGQMQWLSTTSRPVSPRTLPSISQAATPRYAPIGKTPTLREQIFTTRKFTQVTSPAGTMTGTITLASLSNPRLALERGLKRPQTPVYNGSVFNDTWPASTGVSGYFGPPH